MQIAELLREWWCSAACTAALDHVFRHMASWLRCYYSISAAQCVDVFVMVNILACYHWIQCWLVWHIHNTFTRYSMSHNREGSWVNRSVPAAVSLLSFGSPCCPEHWFTWPGELSALVAGVMEADPQVAQPCSLQPQLAVSRCFILL